jgi:hypothetical protein
MSQFENFKTAVMETALNEAVSNTLDPTFKQKIVSDYVKGVLPKDEEKVLTAALQKIKKLRKAKFQIAGKSTEKKLYWDNAQQYVKTLGAGWRLPTLEELEEFDVSGNELVKDSYWSSEQHTNKEYAWTKNFSSGITMYYKKNLPFYVRAVKE